MQVFCYRRLFLYGVLASGMERSGAARRWRAALRSPIREMPCGLDPFGAPGF